MSEKKFYVNRMVLCVIMTKIKLTDREDVSQLWHTLTFLGVNLYVVEKLSQSC